MGLTVKVQGLNLNCGALSFRLQRPKVFNQGQIYAALSWIRSLENMALIEKYTARSFKTNHVAKDEHERLRKENVFTLLPFFQTKKETVTLTLMNKHSLNKHIVHIIRDKQLR